MSAKSGTGYWGEIYFMKRKFTGATGIIKGDLGMKRKGTADLPELDVPCQRLRREIKIWKKLRKSAPFCLAAALGFFMAIGGGTEKVVKGADVLVNYEQWATSYISGYSDPPFNTQPIYSWGAWSDHSPGYRFDTQLQDAVNATGGSGAVRLNNTDTVGVSQSVSPAGNHRYQANWNGNTNANIYTQNSGVLNVTNATGNITIRDERSRSTPTVINQNYQIATINKSGAGALTLDSNSRPNTSFTSTNFTGTAGTLGVNVNYTATNAIVGSNSNTAPFVASVLTGYNWNTTNFKVDSGTFFQKEGAGTLNADVSNISGTATMTAGLWDSGRMDVGYDANGVLNVTGGRVDADSFYVGGSIGKTGTVTMSYGTLNTGMNSGTVEIGSQGTGSVTLGGVSGSVPVWNAQGNTKIGAGATGTVTLNPYSQWNSTGQTDVGYGSGQSGTVNITNNALWNANGQTVNVGTDGDGTVYQNGGTWQNATTNVGLNSGSRGLVEQSGGLHNDVNAYIGVNSANAVYNLSNGGIWNTSNDAVIGVNVDSFSSMPSNGLVTVDGTGSKWTITNNLTVANEGVGELDITDGGVTQVNNGNVIVGVDGTGVVGNQGTVGVDGTGSALLINNGNLTVALGGESVMNITGQGLVDVDKGSAMIGENAGIMGTVNVQDIGSLFHVGNGLTVGGAGTGNLNIELGARTVVTKGDIIIAKEVNSTGQTTVDGNSGDDSTLIGEDGNLIVGDAGNGTLDVKNGGLAQIKGTTTGKGNAIIGNEGTGVGTATIDGEDSRFLVQEDLIVANNGLGTLNVTNGAYTEVTKGEAVIGENNKGIAKIDGQDGSGIPSSLIVKEGDLTVARGGDQSEMTVSDGAVVDVEKGSAIIGENAGITGSVKVNTDATFDIYENLTVGDAGTGSLDIASGAVTTVKTGDATFANQAGSTGTVTVDGTDTQLNIMGGDMTVGNAGTGSLTITNEGVTNVNDGDVIFANQTGSTGTGIVDGLGSELNILDGDLTVANAGNATLTTRNGAYTLVNLGDVYIAVEPGTIGEKTVTGPGSRFDVNDGNVTVGVGGNGTMNILNGGYTDVKLGDVVVGELTGSYGVLNVDGNNGNASTLSIKDGNLTIARGGDLSNMTVLNGGYVEVLSDSDTTKGNAIIAENSGVHGSALVTGNGSLFYVENDLTVGKSGIGDLIVSDNGITNVDGTLITGDLDGSIGTVTLLSGGQVNVQGDDIIGNESGSFGHQLIDGNGSKKIVTGTQVVGNAGQAGGRYLYYQVGTTPANLVDPAPSSAWATSDNTRLTPEDAGWDNIKNNAPGLAITNGGQEQSGRGEVGSLAGGYGYVLLDDTGTNNAWTTKWDVENDMLLGGAGEAYVRVLNGAQLNVGTAGTGTGTLTIGQDGKGNDGGTLRVSGVNGNKRSTVDVEVDMIIAEKNKAEGNLYATGQASVTVGRDLVIAVESGSLGRAHFDGQGTTGTVARTIVIGDAGQAGQKYQYVDANGVTAGYGNLGDPTQWFDSANTLNFLDPAKTTTVPYGAVERNNMPGFAITDGAVVTSTDGVIGNASSGYGYVVIDNKSSTTSSARATWSVANDLTAANAGEAYVRVINGALLEVGGDMTVAQAAGSDGTVRVNGVHPTRTTERATLDVANDLVVADAGTAEGNLYAYDQADVKVGGDMTLADDAGSFGRAHFDGDKTTGTVTGTLTVGNGGQAGQEYQYVPGAGNDADPAKWFDSAQTLDSLSTSVHEQNNMPGLLVSDGAVVKSGSGVVGDEATGYGYVVIDNRNGDGTTSRATWNITDLAGSGLTVGNLGNAYLRVVNGGLLKTDDGIGMIVAAGDGVTQNTGTIRVNGTNPNDGERSALEVGADLTVADETGTNGNMYLYDKAKGEVARDMVLAVEENSHGRAHVDGFGTTLAVAETLTVGLSGNAGRQYQYQAGQYTPGGKDGGDPDVWFDSAQTLDPLTGSIARNNAPGLLISRGAVVTSRNGMIGVTETGTGYVVIDGRDPETGRTAWQVAEDLIAAGDGFAYVRVNHGALLQVDKDLVTARDVNGDGTIRVYGVNANGTASQLNVGGDMVTGGEGDGNFYLYDKANSTVKGDYTVAAEESSYGRAQIDGDGTWMRVDGTVTVGQKGQAGGVYAGDSAAPSPADPTHWFDSQNTLVDLAGSSDLLGNAPGLALTAGGTLSSGYGVVAEYDGSNGYVVIDGKDAGAGRTWWKVDKDLNFGQAGNAYGRVFNGALLEVGTVGGGNMIIGDEGTAVSTLDVYGLGTELLVHGNLTTAVQDGSKGNLYLFDRATAVIDGNHVIADQAGSLGRDYVDGAGTTMTVVGKLTVGNAGQAGGTYTENRYDSRFETGAFTPKANDTLTAGDPEVWFDASQRTMDLISAAFAQTDDSTGNAPGLAITRGAQVISGSGMVGNALGSNGYVVIDNKGNTDTDNDPKTRTWWKVVGTGGDDDHNGNLAIANAGTGFVRVLNGALLQTDSVTMNEGGGDGTLHIVGSGAETDDEGNYVRDENDRFIPLLHDGYRTEWINLGAAALGLGTDAGKSTIRINDGAYAETRGLYIGLEEDSQGAVSVKGAASELHIFEDLGSNWAGSVPKGSATLSVSDWAYLHMHDNSVLLLNGNGMISNGALLHLDENSVLDAMTDRVSVVNARIEGIGTVTGQKGVFVTQDDIFTPEGQAEIDPGLVYNWDARCDDSDYYGTLTFGDQLIMSGNVITYFDVNRGFSHVDPIVPPQQDLIVVKRGTSPNSATVSEDPIIAELSGTLQVHARLTDYYEKDSSFLVVDTEGDSRTGEFVPGRILSMYDNLELVPTRFFNDIRQDIRQDTRGNDDLWINMERKDNPFEEAGITYNQKQTGSALDSIYAEQRQDWLPFLRHFWYLGDPEFLDSYKDLSGEVRAHSMMMALRSPWRYIQDRIDTGRSCFDEGYSPCNQAEQAGCHPWKKRLKECRLWGGVIYEDEDVSGDGNAQGYDLTRKGIAVGIDYQLKNTMTYVGFMFAYDEGKLNTYRSRAESDDFNFGIYHKSLLQRNWEWKNYLGMGYQDYDMWRDANFGLAHMEWDGSKYLCSSAQHGGQLNSAFKGYSFAASTELARTFEFGRCHRNVIRPFVALDLMGTRQRAASEHGNFENLRYVALNFNKASDMRVYFRPGVSWERGGPRGVLRAQAAYSFLIGGHSYARASNRFQYGGDTFTVRSVDDGIGYVTVNLGASAFLDHLKTSTLTFDYWLLGGEHSTTHALQFGVQKKF